MKITGLRINARHAALGMRLLGYWTGGFLTVCCALDGRAPLTAGLLAAMRPGAAGGAVLLGGMTGAAVLLEFGAALRCCGILVLIAAVLSTFRDTRWFEYPYFRPLTALAATLSVETAYLIQMGLDWNGFFRLCASAVFSGALCHYCTLLLRETSIPRHRESREAERLRERLRLSADALRSLCESFSVSSRKKDEDPSVIFDRAAEVVCRGCALCEICWSKEYISTFNAFNDAIPAILERGRAESSDFALHFASRCIHFPQLISAINTEVSALLLRRQYRRQLETERQRACGQYAQLSELVVQAMSAPQEIAAPERELPYDVALGSVPKEGQRVCGDSVTYFKGGGKLHLLLSDGMGSGREAQRESQLALRLIERFLTAGIEPEPALRTLNAALNIRSEEHGAFTTVDLLSLDLENYQAALCKYGAAPTYIKRNGSVRRITGTALPAGLQEAGSNVPPVQFPLEENTFVLMVSDGIVEGGEDHWLQDLLAGWQGDNPNVLVSLVLRECHQRRGGDDDCSALCLYLPPNHHGRREV
ncbi:MAG: SpoIIE family protein phosphatase [Oscillospiraceae bacterium]|nr:SpoIIE family protein phosphatase [Oscillospiraceae bacterium]